MDTRRRKHSLQKNKGRHPVLMCPSVLPSLCSASSEFVFPFPPNLEIKRVGIWQREMRGKEAIFGRYVCRGGEGERAGRRMVRRLRALSSFPLSTVSAMKVPSLPPLLSLPSAVAFLSN